MKPYVMILKEYNYNRYFILFNKYRKVSMAMFVSGWIIQQCLYIVSSDLMFVIFWCSQWVVAFFSPIHHPKNIIIRPM